MKFIASVWRGSDHNDQTGAGYGISIKLNDRYTIFDRSWGQVELDLSGKVVIVPLLNSFWKGCNELRSKSIGEWLIANKVSLNWPKGSPPDLSLTQVRNNLFKVELTGN